MDFPYALHSGIVYRTAVIVADYVGIDRHEPTAIYGQSVTQSLCPFGCRTTDGPFGSAPCRSIGLLYEVHAVRGIGLRVHSLGLRETPRWTNLVVAAHGQISVGASGVRENLVTWESILKGDIANEKGEATAEFLDI